MNADAIKSKAFFERKNTVIKLSLIIEGISDKVSQFQNVTEVNQLAKNTFLNIAERLKQHPIFFVVTFFQRK
jgi:hypothetical protein